LAFQHAQRDIKNISYYDSSRQMLHLQHFREQNLFTSKQRNRLWIKMRWSELFNKISSVDSSILEELQPTQSLTEVIEIRKLKYFW